MYSARGCFLVALILTVTAVQSNPSAGRRLQLDAILKPVRSSEPVDVVALETHANAQSEAKLEPTAVLSAIAAGVSLGADVISAALDWSIGLVNQAQVAAMDAAAKETRLQYENTRKEHHAMATSIQDILTNAGSDTIAAQVYWRLSTNEIIRSTLGNIADRRQILTSPMFEAGHKLVMRLLPHPDSAAKVKAKALQDGLGAVKAVVTELLAETTAEIGSAGTKAAFVGADAMSERALEKIADAAARVKGMYEDAKDFGQKLNDVKTGKASHQKIPEEVLQLLPGLQAAADYIAPISSIAASGVKLGSSIASFHHKLTACKDIRALFDKEAKVLLKDLQWNLCRYYGRLVYTLVEANELLETAIIKAAKSQKPNEQKAEEAFRQVLEPFTNQFGKIRTTVDAQFSKCKPFVELSKSAEKRKKPIIELFQLSEFDQLRIAYDNRQTPPGSPALDRIPITVSTVQGASAWFKFETAPKTTELGVHRMDSWDPFRPNPPRQPLDDSLKYFYWLYDKISTEINPKFAPIDSICQKTYPLGDDYTSQSNSEYAKNWQSNIDKFTFLNPLGTERVMPVLADRTAARARDLYADSFSICPLQRGHPNLLTSDQKAACKKIANTQLFNDYLNVRDRRTPNSDRDKHTPPSPFFTFAKHSIPNALGKKLGEKEVSEKGPAPQLMMEYARTGVRAPIIDLISTDKNSVPKEVTEENGWSPIAAVLPTGDSCPDLKIDAYYRKDFSIPDPLVWTPDGPRKKPVRG